jgi:hypothetical protein
MSTDLLKTIGRIRRAMPRNADVMEICDALEASLSKPTEYRHIEVGYAISGPVGERVGNMYEKFDKRAYQRNYMRKRRARLNATSKD